MDDKSLGVAFLSMLFVEKSVSFSDDPPDHGKQHSPTHQPGCNSIFPPSFKSKSTFIIIIITIIILYI